MIAKTIGGAGLVLNMMGAICLWWIVPRGSTMHYGRPTPVPFKPLARVAQRVGWPLLTIGFALQLIGIVVAP